MIGFPDIINHKIIAWTVFEQLPYIPLRVCSFVEQAFKHLQEKLAKNCAQSKECLSMLQKTDVRILKFFSYKSKKVRIIFLIWEPLTGKCHCFFIFKSENCFKNSQVYFSLHLRYKSRFAHHGIQQPLVIT